MEEPGDLLEDSWFFGNLLHTKTRTISRCYSDLTSSSCPPLPPLCSNQESIVKNERKNSSVSSRKQPPIAPRNLNRTPSLPNSVETQSFIMKNTDTSPHLSRTSSMTTSEEETDQDEDEEDQESEFSLGRLIRQASMNSSHTSNPSRKTSKATMENMGKKPELGQEKIRDEKKTERNRSKNIKISGKNKNGGGAPAIPGGWVDKSSSEDMKAHIKYWARAVASNVRQECS
ncbi:uncharacterized protein LOC111919972 [Lactuca sativa]|nr:uncharacterized protein LOC111919972 [Lactuca sativa]